MIELAGVQAELGAFRLGPIDARFSAGSFVGLIGPPGSGKSALLKLLAGLLAPSAGRVLLFDGQPPASHRRDIGVVFQNNALFDSRTLGENVAFPLQKLGGLAPHEIQARVAESLAAVGLASAAARYPHELSGGMQKRAGIARALALRPVIRLYDEPTAGLDPVTSARILRLIQELDRERPGVSVVVSNEMDTLLAVVPRVLMLHEGRALFDGPREALSAGAAPELARRFVSGDVSAPL